MTKKRPLVFIGSSSEGLDVAKAIQAELQHSPECVIWSQGTFGLSEGTLESLVNKLEIYDFAILVLTPDDLISSRGETQPAPRDNVLLELGMFIGGLGRERTFIVVDRSAKMKLPSDLAGITPATYQPPERGTMQSAVGPACTDIDKAIQELGFRNNELPVEITGSYQCIGRHSAGVAITIKNLGNKDIPPYKIGICCSNMGNLFLFLSEKDGKPLLPDQQREHFCQVIKNGELQDWCSLFNSNRVNEPLDDSDYDGFEFQLVLEDSDKILYVHKQIGLAFVRIIQNALEHGSMDGSILDNNWEDFRKLSTGYYEQNGQ